MCIHESVLNNVKSTFTKYRLRNGVCSALKNYHYIGSAFALEEL